MAQSHRDKGVSLARLPALIIGSILLTFGLLAFLVDGSSPTDGFPDGTITDAESFLGFDVNDWTAFFTAAAGGLLLFGAAQHLLAKTMSLVVGLALGACSVIALVDGDDVLGLAAANGWTKLGWGVAAAALLINALLPRKGGKDHDVDVDRDVHREPVAAPRREPVRAEPVDTRRVEPVDTRRAEPDTHVTRVDEAPGPEGGRFERDRGLDDRDGIATGDRTVRDDGVRDDGSVADDRLRGDRIR